MKLITIGHKMPAWIAEGFTDYQKRLSKPWSLELIELPGKTKVQEGRLILEKLPAQAFCVALDVKGQTLSTEALAQKLELWQLDMESKEICFVIGGADGLDETVLKRANFIWSLSALTFPHQLVKVILAEQLYRGVSVLNKHPYHRS